MIGRSLPLLLALTLLLPAGCDKKSPADKPSPPEESKPDPDTQPPSFDWRKALQATPAEAAEALGEPSDCAEAGKAARAPEDADGARAASPPDPTADEPDFCRYPADQTPPGTYRIAGIAWVDGTPVALRLTPAEPVALSEQALETFGLPDLPVRRHRLEQTPDGQRPVLSYRADRIPAETPSPVAIDLRGDDVEGEAGATATLFAWTDAWPAVLEHVRLEGPAPVDDHLILARTFSGDSPLGNVAMEVGVDEVRLHRWADYGLRRPDADSPLTEVAPVVFERRRLSGPAEPDPDTGDDDAGDNESGWEADVERFILELQGALEEAERRGPRLTFTVAPTQTTPVGQLDELMMLIRGLTEAKIQLMGRRVATLGADFTRYADARAVNLQIASADAHLEGGKAGPRRGVLPDRGESYLDLTVTAGLEGFDVRAGGAKLPPVDDCPDPGPTLCLPDPNAEPTKAFAKAEQHHRDGDLPGADAAHQTAMALYDWPALYDLLTRLADRYPNARSIYVDSDPALPVALPMRVITLAADKLGDEEGTCVAEFADAEALLEAAPCGESMFPRATWLL